MQKLNFTFRISVFTILLLFSACSFQEYEPNYSDEQILILEKIENIIKHDMEKSNVKTVLEDAEIKYSEKLSGLFSLGNAGRKYQNVDTIFVDISPAVQTGCWDAVLVIIKFNPDGRVSRIKRELANFCG